MDGWMTEWDCARVYERWHMLMDYCVWTLMPACCSLPASRSLFLQRPFPLLHYASPLHCALCLTCLQVIPSAAICLKPNG
eukprot:scaffold34557_cov21-Tisochrysis_lutea.AAC.4